MTLNSLLSYKGITLSKDMDTLSIINCLSSYPTVLSAFPSIQNYVTTLKNTLESLYKAQDTLADTRKKLTQAEETLAKAEDGYNQILSLPGAYITTAPSSPVSPGSVTAGYAIITSAKKGLEAAQKAVNKAEEAVNKIVAKIDEYKSDMMDTLKNTQVD